MQMSPTTSLEMFYCREYYADLQNLQTNLCAWVSHGVCMIQAVEVSLNNRRCIQKKKKILMY